MKKIRCNGKCENYQMRGTNLCPWLLSDSKYKRFYCNTHILLFIKNNSQSRNCGNFSSYYLIIKKTLILNKIFDQERKEWRIIFNSFFSTWNKMNRTMNEWAINQTIDWNNQIWAKQFKERFEKHFLLRNELINLQQRISISVFPLKCWVLNRNISLHI